MAIVIKNTLLLVLIILIGHFMIKNILMDKKPSTQPVATAKPSEAAFMNYIQQSQKTKKESEPKKQELPIGNNTDDLTEVHFPIPSKDDLPKVQGGLDKAKEELLKFIDDDDEEGVIEKYFDSKTGPVPSDNCKPKESDNMFPLSTTCDPNLQTLPSTDKNVKANCNLNQDKKNVMILKEYENESSMNGGTLYGGLNAFDTFDHSFQELV